MATRKRKTYRRATRGKGRSVKIDRNGRIVATRVYNPRTKRFKWKHRKVSTKATRKHFFTRVKRFLGRK